MKIIGKTVFDFCVKSFVYLIFVVILIGHRVICQWLVPLHDMQVELKVFFYIRLVEECFT